ncbi:MAG: ribosomal RNA small subunit methyltransferase A [Phycisphaerales bacterium]|nr:ribosomal RNA small subunit methyltransferase A [Phycisphaerales bacterium]
MQSLTRIKELLEMAGHGPKKALGQNFLIDQNLINKLIDASGVGAGDLVLEIGPGTGALTVGLLERGCRVIACELDTDLARVLRETLGAEYPDLLTIIEGDCLAGKKALNSEVASAIGDEGFCMVANLPYHAATPVMMTLMTRHGNCRGMYVTIQREVVDRFAAGSGSKTYGMISVVAQCLGEVRMIAKLKPGCFWPAPGVESAMMGWTRDVGLVGGADPGWWVQMSELAQSLFQSRRKKLGGVVKKMVDGGEVAWPDGVSGDDRVDSLDPERVHALCRSIAGVIDTER